MNQVILIGRLTRDPEVRRTPDGKAVGNYTLAVDRKYAKADQKADFIRCVVWEKKAEFAERYLHKGTKIAVTGRIQTGEYTNQRGEKVYTTDVVVEEQEFCEKKQTEDRHEETYTPEFVEPAPGEKLPWD